MINIDKITVFNFEGAFRGLRNPMNSWDRSDSHFACDDSLSHRRIEYREGCAVDLGDADLDLAQRMIGAGTDESKFMRQIFVSMDITAPLYYWKQMDQYRIGVVTNSESTMHRLTQTPITRECFSFDEELDALDTQFYGQEVEGFLEYFSLGLMNETTISTCERLRQKYLETKDKRYWRALIQLLPESWNQKRTWTANYQVLRAIYFARRYHKLQEWKDFCQMIEELPYGKELICYIPSEKKIKE
jgi:hypothetical protein